MEDDISFESTPQDSGLGGTLARISGRTREMETAANGFARAMSSAFSRSVADGKSFDDVLKSMALRLSELSLRLAMKPLLQSALGGSDGLLSNLLGSSGGSSAATTADSGLLEAMTQAQPFANGGVIGTPTYFPLGSAGLGLAGEAGAEAIVPLARGPDGSLGVASNGGGAPSNVIVNITTPDPGSFRRSEAHLTGLISRAVARGQRSL